MQAMTYTNFRQNLRSVMNKVNEDVDTVVVTANDGNNIVVMSESEFNSWKETMYLLRSPANRKHILESVAQLDAGKGTRRELLDEQELL